MNRRITRYGAAAALAVCLGAGCEGAVNDDDNFFVLTFRSSVSETNSEGNGPSSRPVMTPDGRYLIFQSRATNLVTADINNRSDIFRKDLQTGEVLLISVSAAGGQVDGNSSNATVSDDGRFIAFESDATNLVGGDANGQTDVFVRDLDSGTTTRASVRSDESQGPLGAASFNPAISGDGRYVAFESDDRLVAADVNGQREIYVRDIVLGETTRVSLSSLGGDPDNECINAAISGDGQFVTFQSKATNINPLDPPLDTVTLDFDIFVVQWQSPLPVIERISVEDPSNPDVTSDGIDSNGDSVQPRISPDGRFVVFLSSADDLVVGDSNGALVLDVFIRDRALGTTERASVSSQGAETTRSSFEASVSSDGRWVVYTSEAPELVQGDTNNTSDIFLRDNALKTTIRVSVATYGVQSAAFFPNANGAVSGDGKFVAFASAAPNLAPNDQNGVLDILVRGPLY